MEFTWRKALFICCMAGGILWFSNPISDYFFDYLADPNEMEIIIAKSWNKTIDSPKPENMKFHAIAIGINAGIDIIVKGTDLLKKLGTDEKEESTIKATDRESINNLRQLQEVFTYFHSKGAGGERFMNNKELFAKAVGMSKAMPGAELYVGGNAALMAQAIVQASAKNVHVLFGGMVGPGLSPMLNRRLIVPSKLKAEEDEYHIILEYVKGEKWAGHVCPIASRFIFSHDLTNSRMLASEKFIDSLKEFNPDMVVLTGLHLLEGQPEAYWKRRLAEIAASLAKVSTNVPIHTELASMANPAFVKALTERILPMVDSIGLNEQELWMTCQANGGPHCKPEYELDGPPSPGVSNDIIHWMLQQFSKRRIPSSRLSRVHFHTLVYHTVATLDSSKWRYGDSSVAAGARIASTQSCGVHSVHPAKVELRLKSTIPLTAGGLPENVEQPKDTRLDYSNPIISWKTSKISFFMTPVLVCQNPVKTVGLGDAISSMGLLHSGYDK
uniref:ADP-dependent glucokinase-like n=1 Tax=Styela clava TaxID=7725 RepID=UPI00193ABB04|nr:ADP-dependent glucokinase-like [Styela clava]